MKLNFPLSDFDLFIDEDFLQAAEKVAVRELTMPDKYLWAIRTAEGEEVEIQTSAQRVKAVTCTCATFQRYAMCGDIVAALQALRNRKQREQKAKKDLQLQKLQAQADRAAERQKQVSVPNILRKVDAESLHTFVADYARQNPTFALALQSRFAVLLVEPTHLVAHYQDLLEKTQKTLNQKTWGQILLIFSEIKQKAYDYLKKGEMPIVIHFLILALGQLHRYLRLSDSPRPRLMKKYEELLVLAHSLKEFQLAIELQTEWQNWLQQEFQQYYRQDFADDIFSLILAQNTPQMAIFLSHQIEKVKEKELKNKLIVFNIQLLQQQQDFQATEQLIGKYPEETGLWLFAAQNASEKGYYTIAKKMVEKGLLVFEEQATKRSLKDILLPVLVIQNDWLAVKGLSYDLLLSTFELRYLKVWLQTQPPREEAENLLVILNEYPYRLEKRDIVAELLIYLQQPERLAEWIIELQSLELLKNYGAWLIAQNAELALPTHLNVLDKYLNQHFGRLPAQRVKILLDTYHQQRVSSLFIHQITDFLTEKYSDRGALMEEIFAIG